MELTGRVKCVICLQTAGCYLKTQYEILRVNIYYQTKNMKRVSSGMHRDPEYLNGKVREATRRKKTYFKAKNIKQNQNQTKQKPDHSKSKIIMT